MLNMVKKPKKILYGLLILLLLFPGLLFANLAVYNQNIYKHELPLLLNSGLVDCETSDVKYILWTNKSSALPVLDQIVNNSGDAWEKNVICDFTGKRIYKYIREDRVDSIREKDITEYLNQLEKQISGWEISLYFQQTIKGNLDIETYIQTTKVREVQRVETDEFVSLTGYNENIRKSIWVAVTPINTQILTRQSGSAAKTTLAIPALLEEF